MTKLVSIEKVEFARCPTTASKGLERAEKLCEELENGNIIFFPTCPFDFSEEKIEFLLQQKQKKKKNRRRIAYKPHLNRLTHAHTSQKDFEKLHQTMRDFSQAVTTFLSKLLTPYASKWKIDYANFCPFQEKARRARSRNDLLHTDVFSERPIHGKRILRFFMNINPNENRRWATGDHFEDLIKKFGGKQELPYPSPIEYSFKARMSRYIKKTARTFGFPLKLKSPYDHFMLQLHHFLKENQDFQNNSEKSYWDFPPGSCWMVFTDFLTHAALPGKYTLEQTFLIPREAQMNPEKAPISILEKEVGYQMLDPTFSK